MNEQELLKRIAATKVRPDITRDLTPGELADLVLVVLGYVKKVNADVERGRLKGDPGRDAYTPKPDVDYLSLPSAKREIDALIASAVSEMRSDISEKLGAVRDGRDGRDAEVTDEHIERAAAIAASLIELPDFATLITSEPAAIRDSLELLSGDERLSIDAIRGLSDVLAELAARATTQKVLQGKSLLSFLNDVDVEGIANGETLVWNSTREKFEPGAAGGGSGTVDTANSPNAGEFARFTDADTIEGRTAAEARADLGLVIGTDVQAYDADLTTWASLTPSANAQSLVTAANYAAMRALLDLEPGTDFLSPAAIAAAYQPLDAELTALAGLTSAADKLPYFTGAGTAAVADFSAFARTLVDDADASSARTTLGLVIGTNVQAYDAFLQNIADLTDPNADRIPFWDDSAGAIVWLTVGSGLTITGTTISATGGGTIDGSGTTNEIAYWVDADTLGSLATATYPSLTELSYVKGVTSAIQTQLGTKAASATTITVAGTANEITSSAGAQDLSASRTWTLSLPSALTFTSKTVTGGTFSSPTLTTPQFADLGFIADASGNEMLQFDSTPSAVNYVRVGNAATANQPLISAQGDDANVSLWFQAKGSGHFGFRGTTSGSAVLRLYEDTDNGQNAIDLTVPAAITSDATITFPEATGTVVLNDNTATLSNKTISLGSNTVSGSVSDFNAALTGADFYTSGGTDVALADGGTGASLTDPNADRVMFWDDSAGAVTWLTVGSGLTITDTTISATGGSVEATTKSVSQASHGFVVGDVLKYASSTYSKAQADSAANAEVVGIVSSVADANTFTLTTVGYVSGLSGLTANTTYYLSPSTAGLLTSTEPTTVGQISKPLFRAVSTTAGYFFNYRGIAIVSLDTIGTQTLTDAATIAVNFASGATCVVTLGGNRTMGTPSNAVAGGRYRFIVKQDGTGGRTLTWNAEFKFPGGVEPTLSTGISDVDVFTFIAESSSVLYCVGAAFDQG